ncbi:MAG: nuclear transport factor 2 family protein [Cyanobacteria bacterium P01_F01_bin.53]
MNTVELDKARATLDKWLTAFNAKDVDTLIALYDPESVYANAAAPLLRGVAQIKPWFKKAFPNIKGTLHYKEETAFLEGTMALLSGVYYFEPPAGVTPKEDDNLTGRVLVVFRRNAAGEWKLLFDMDNTPPDVSPALFS